MGRISSTLSKGQSCAKCLLYVLQNHRKHSRSTALDPLSSAALFEGFASPLPATFRSIGPPCTAAASTWLLKRGWLRHGLIRLAEGPAVR